MEEKQMKYLVIPSNSTIVIVLTPLLLLFVPLYIPGKESTCAYVMLLTAVYWITGCLSIGVTSFVPVILFAVTGTLTINDLTKAFFFSGLWLLLGSFMLAVAAETTKLHLRIALKVLLVIGAQPRRLMLGFMLATFLLSMWMSNTVVAAMMIPIVEGVVTELRIQRKLELSKQRKMNVNERKVNDTKIAFAEEKQISKNNSDSDQSCDEDDEIELMESGDSKGEDSMRKLFKAISISVPFSASIGGVATITGTAPNLAAVSVLKRTFPDSPEISYGTWFFYCFPGALLNFVVAYAWLSWFYFGFSPRSWFDRKCTCSKDSPFKNLSAKKMLLNEYAKLGPLRWEEKWVIASFVITAVLWFTRNPGFVSGWSVFFDRKYVNDGIVAMAAAFLLFLIPKKRPALFTTEIRRYKKRKMIRKILSWNDVHHLLKWELIFIFGGGLVLAEGAKVSGLSLWFTSQLLFLVDSPPWIACLCLSVMAMLLTECTSNTAMANIMLPVLIQMAVVMEVHPFYMSLAPILSTSLAFMLPVATPPNAIAYSTGHFKIIDMVKAGWFLNVVGVLIITLSINTYGIALLGLNEFPSWARPSNTSSLISDIEATTASANVTTIHV